MKKMPRPTTALEEDLNIRTQGHGKRFSDLRITECTKSENVPGMAQNQKSVLETAQNQKVRWLGRLLGMAQNQKSALVRTFARDGLQSEKCAGQDVC